MMRDKNISFNPPRGMRDFYPEDMAVRNAIFDAWTKASLLFGFREYDSSVVESLDILKRKSGDEIVEQIYAFKDKSGRDLALRPEITPTLARMVAARQGALAFPLKWYTIAQCFRYERMTLGRKREHYQWNLDIIGEESVAAEAEVIATAIRALSLLGLAEKEVMVHFNNRAMLADILRVMGIPPEYHSLTFLALDKRGKIEEDNIMKMLKDAGMDSQSIDRIFGILQISSLEESLSILKEKTPSYLNTVRLLDSLNFYGIGHMVKFDISVVRGLAYYTGIVFEAFDVDKKFRAIFGGGRYDNLLADIGGNPATGVGLGFGDVVIAELLSGRSNTIKHEASAHVAIGFMSDDQRSTAINIATSLRSSGKSVDLALSSEKAKSFFSRAGKGGFREAVYIGPDDVAKGMVRIKNLETREEREESIMKSLNPNF